MSIADSFQRLLAGLEPNEVTLLAAETRIDAIRARLKQTFGVVKVEKIGSYTRDTFIRTSSDVDVLAMLSRNDVRWGDRLLSSTTVLTRLRSELADRYAATDVYKDGPAIVAAFRDCAIDVVPAFYQGPNAKGWPIYAMPDGNGGWMPTSPDLHNKYLAECDGQSTGKLRSTARLLKFWRECRKPKVPISSFHIEMILASEGTCRGPRSYAACVLDILQSLARRECRALQDPVQVSGLIAGCKTESQRLAALNTVRSSRDHAARATDAMNNGDLEEARRQWDLVFNGAFPW